MKKKLLAYLSLFVLFVLFMPCANAKEIEKEKVICNYEYEGMTLSYKVYDDKVVLPFKDGESNWYHGAEFKNTYISSSKENSITYVCPTITIEKSDSFTTIFNNPVNEDNCNGICTTISATTMQSSKNITVKKAVDTTAIGSVGIYNNASYFLPYFRLLDDGTKQWSVNGKQFFATDETILIKDLNTKVKLDKKLEKEIYKENKLNNDVKIYRNVKEKSNAYTYLLSTEKEKGYSLTDGQENASASYNGALGANDNCVGILGNPNDSKSVAWLVQKILDYMRVIAPFIVVIMSGIDFAKVVILSDDENMKKAQSKLITRLLLAGSLFFLVEIVRALLALFGLTTNPLCGIN